MGKRAQIRRAKLEEADKQRREALAEIRKAKNPIAGFWRRADFWVYSISLIMLIVFPFLNPKLKELGVGQPTDSNASSGSKETAIIHTAKGDIGIQLYKNDAPKTVDNFVQLSRRGYYNNLTFHRIIKDFMIQGGDPNGDGSGGESAFGAKFEDEINPISLGLADEQIQQLESQGYKYNYGLNSHKMDVGVIAMANSGPNTNGSQFFIVTEQPQPHLDGKHTVFGTVTSGMEVVRAIASVETGENDKPTEPVYISSIEIK